MTTSTTIAVTVSAEAAARIKELGMHAEYEAMLEHAKQTVPGLRAIDVTLEYAPWLSEDPKIILNAYRPHLGPEEKVADDNWTTWFLESVPPQARLHFLLMPFYEATDGR